MAGVEDASRLRMAPRLLPYEDGCLRGILFVQRASALGREDSLVEFAAGSAMWKKNPAWFENEGRAARPGLNGLAAPDLNSNCPSLIISP